MVWPLLLVDLRPNKERTRSPIAGFLLPASANEEESELKVPNLSCVEDGGVELNRSKRSLLVDVLRSAPSSRGCKRGVLLRTVGVGGCGGISASSSATSRDKRSVFAIKAGEGLRYDEGGGAPSLRPGRETGCSDARGAVGSARVVLLVDVLPTAALASEEKLSLLAGVGSSR